MGNAGVTQTWTGPEKAHVAGELYEQEYRYVWTLGASQASLYWVSFEVLNFGNINAPGLAIGNTAEIWQQQFNKSQLSPDGRGR